MNKNKEQMLLVVLAILSVMFTIKEMFQSLEDIQQYLLNVMLCVPVFALILLYMKHRKPTERKRKSHLRSIDYMKLDDYQFEHFCANVLNANGYQMAVTRKGGDGGKDLVGWNDKNQRIFGEVKHYKDSNKVSRPLMQKLKGAMVDSGVDRGIFITTSSFTREALEYAKRNKIQCIDRGGLERLIRRA